MAPKRIAGLEPYREDEGFISLQVDFHGHHRKARKRAGITKWPDDICRHTFASNHFSEFTRLMVEMNHTTTKVLFAHYHRHVPEPGKQGEGGDFTLHHQSSIFFGEVLTNRARGIHNSQMEWWNFSWRRPHRSLHTPFVLGEGNGGDHGGGDGSGEDPRHIALGEAGEDLATHFLRAERMKILHRNFRAPNGGEVDIVCRDKDVLVFAEVKTRSSERFGRPMDAVDEEKQRLIARGGIGWLRLLGFPDDILIRFDVIEVIAKEGQVPVIRRIGDAFQLPDGYYP